MLRLSVLTFSMFLVTITQAQVPKCCSAEDAPKVFAQMGNDPNFVNEHQNPGLFKLDNPQGERVSFAVTDGKDGEGYYINRGEESSQWIFVFHEWYGLNDYVRFEAEKLAEEFPEAHILAIDLYDGKVGKNREEASALMKAMKDDRARAIIQGASGFAGQDATIATIGWCFGGTWSFQSALMLGDQVEACVMYYGMPVADAKDLEALKAPVLGIFAEQDGWITPEVVSDFENAMDEAGKQLTVKSYDANHAFANPSNEVYDESARQDAWGHAVQFIRSNLK